LEVAGKENRVSKKLLLVRGTRSHLSGEMVLKKLEDFIFVTDDNFPYDKEEHFDELLQIIRKKYKYKISLRELDDLLLMKTGCLTPVVYHDC
jgi:hypothetical protein